MGVPRVYRIRPEGCGEDPSDGGTERTKGQDLRFVSKYPQLGLGTCIKEKFVLALDGQRDKTQESVAVQFSQMGLMQTDIRAALDYWPESAFRGRWVEADGVTQEPVAGRIGVFDTEEQGWDDQTRQTVETWLLAKPNYGADFIVVEVAKIAPPWPNYDKAQWKQIAPLAHELGLLEEAIAYERENKNRESVLSMLEEAKGKPVSVETDDLVAA